LEHADAQVHGRNAEAYEAAADRIDALEAALRSIIVEAMEEAASNDYGLGWQAGAEACAAIARECLDE
jgi:hypothetical protein